MAHEGQEIVNPRTGQRLTFVEIRPDILRMDSMNPPGAKREPVHVHPRQESGAEVYEGSLVFEVAGEQRRLSAGETITIPAGTPHQFWNDGPGDARSLQYFRPALASAAFFETLFALGQRRELDPRGMRRPPQRPGPVPGCRDEIPAPRPPRPRPS